MALVNHVDKRNFDINLANITPCSPVRFVYMPLEEAFYSMNLHPTHGFVWHRELMGYESMQNIPLTIWDV